MNTMTCKILTASIVLALSCGLGAEAKGSKTKIMTDPSITQKAIEAQMDQTVANKDVNFNNMLLQKNLASSITEAAAPEAVAMDIDLKGAVTTAIQNNRDITIAELKRREAEADVSAAAAKKNPSVSYSWQRNQYPTQHGVVDTQSSNHGYSQGINVSWPIWTFGKVEGAIDAARYQKNIADLNVYKTEADTKLAAVQAYYQYLEAVKLAEVQAQSVTDYASHLNNVQQQFDAGIVAKLDVLSSNVSLANAKQKSIAADNTRDVAEANLNNIMRIPMNTTLNPLDKNFPEPEFDLTMEQAILMAQKYRWELVEADYGVRAAEASLRSAKARYLPTVSVGGGYSWEEASMTAVDKDDWAVQGGLSWSLWDGGATQASVKKADAVVKTAQETRCRREKRSSSKSVRTT